MPTHRDKADRKELHGPKSESLQGEKTKHLIMILAAFVFVFIGIGAMKAFTCIVMHADINVKVTADNDIFCMPPLRKTPLF